LTNNAVSNKVEPEKYKHYATLICSWKKCSTSRGSVAVFLTSRDY